MPDLNAKMAREVMGWFYTRRYGDGEEYYWRNANGQYLYEVNCTSPGPYWTPTTNLDQAFMLVEKMRENNLWLLFITGIESAENKPISGAIFLPYLKAALLKTTTDINLLAWADTPSEAICKAIEAALESRK